MPEKRIILAEYFTTDDLTLLFLIRKDFDEPEVIEIKKSLREIQGFVREHFQEERDEEGNLLKTTSDKVRNLDETAYQKFFAPFIDPLIAHSSKGDPMTNPGDIIWLVPHDVLHYLPLHALKVEGQYLIERNPICYTPSASVMKYCHAKRKGRREKALVLGHSAQYPLLFREEALAVARLFETTLYLDGEATKARFKAMLEKARDEFDLLHFSCHGYFDPYQALQSGIVLAPDATGTEEDTNRAQGHLTAEEIFGLALNADLVTLSACETGINDRRPGDELIGLTRALIYAGTPSVAVSLWRVNGLATQILMESFYTALKAGKMKAEALQQAQIHLMQMTYGQACTYVDQKRTAIEAQSPAEAAAPVDVLDLALLALEADAPVDAVDDRWRPFVHPYHWAPFVLVGDWQ